MNRLYQSFNNNSTTILMVVTLLVVLNSLHNIFRKDNKMIEGATFEGIDIEALNNVASMLGNEDGTVKVKNIELTGSLTVNGNSIVNGNNTVKGTSTLDGAITSKGEFNTTGNITATNKIITCGQIRPTSIWSTGSITGNSVRIGTNGPNLSWDATNKILKIPVTIDVNNSMTPNANKDENIPSIYADSIVLPPKIPKKGTGQGMLNRSYVPDGSALITNTIGFQDKANGKFYTFVGYKSYHGKNYNTYLGTSYQDPRYNNTSVFLN